VTGHTITGANVSKFCQCKQVVAGTSLGKPYHDDGMGPQI